MSYISISAYEKHHTPCIVEHASTNTAEEDEFKTPSEILSQAKQNNKAVMLLGKNCEYKAVWLG